MKTSYCTLKSEIIDGKQYKYFFKLLLLNHLQLLLIKMMNDFVNIWNCLGIFRWIIYPETEKYQRKQGCFYIKNVSK